jgi:CheY-like chemotaxis protein
MSDALNSPFSNSNGRGSIPGDILGGSCQQDQNVGAADDGANATTHATQPADESAPNSISSAAAQTARTLGIESSARNRNGNCVPSSDRRRRRRALISAPLRVRSVDTTGDGPDEISTTADVSRGGILFLTQSKSFERGMEVAVTFPYTKTPGVLHAEQFGSVARVHAMPDGRFAVAIAIGQGVGEDLVDSCGRKLHESPVRVWSSPEHAATKLLVLAVEADEACRDSLRNYLTNEGYEVIAVKNGPEAREVLDRFVPALLIAEVEGEGLPGFELCAFVKTTERLKKVPVLLTTRNGNPTDYSNAHSLGAVVCMAKPYKQERLGHVVRLLAPPPQALAQNTPAPRPPDPSRRTFNGLCTKPAPSHGGSRRFRFPSFR